MNRNEFVEVRGIVTRATDKAVLVYPGNGLDNVWLPRSEIYDGHALRHYSIGLRVPRWLAEDKNLIIKKGE